MAVTFKRYRQGSLGHKRKKILETLEDVNFHDNLFSNKLNLILLAQICQENKIWHKRKKKHVFVV